MPCLLSGSMSPTAPATEENVNATSNGHPGAPPAATAASAAPAAKAPRDTQELQRAQVAVSRFARSLQVLVRAARLYQKNHPHVMESLEAVDTDLRGALDKVCPLELGVERPRLIFRGQPLADARGELKKLAEALHRRGIFTLVFLPQTHLGELGTFVQALAASPMQAGDPEEPLDWAALLEEKRINGIRVNQPLAPKKADTVLTTLVAAVLAPEGDAAASPGADPQAFPTVEEWAGLLRLLARIAAPLRREESLNPRQVMQPLRAAVAGEAKPVVQALAAAMTRNAPRDGENLEPYFCRLAESMAIEFSFEHFRAGRVPLPELRRLFQRLAREMDACGLRPTRPGGEGHRLKSGARWTNESYAERLHETFWDELPAPERTHILNGPHAWCVPISSLRPYAEQLAHSGSTRPARFVLLNFARLLESTAPEVRLAVANGLSEMRDLVPLLWPAADRGHSPDELAHVVTRALLAETAPEAAGLLAGVTDALARLAQERREYAALEKILHTLDAVRLGLLPPRPNGTNAPATSLVSTLLQRILENGRWQAMVDQTLEHRPLDPALPRILARDPERVLDALSARLTQPEGLAGLAPMARLLRAIGEPATGALVSRLFDPRTQRATAAVKLLAAARPERLVEALPKALHGWDWALQDLAVGELTRQGVPGAARAFLQVLPLAHTLVAPMMIDEIGLAEEFAAVPLLVLIAAGAQDPLKDVFIRIKAIEALGRLAAPEAADTLRAILRQRNGLTYTEPAGLRSAAEEALGLIENHPSSARVRKTKQAVAHSSLSFTRPRRYLRVPLDSPLPAKLSLERPAAREAGAAASPAAVRVTTISLGGAFVVSGPRLTVGDSCQLEIRNGLRRIAGTAVVRNVSPSGGGVEFVHMTQDDREKLRQLVTKLLRH